LVDNSSIQARQALVQLVSGQDSPCGKHAPALCFNESLGDVH
jgi:hypothetical protein